MKSAARQRPSVVTETLVLGGLIVCCVLGLNLSALAAGWTAMYDWPANGSLLGDDCRGNLWLSSPVGLVRCDGAGFTTYGACDGLALSDVKGCVEDWLGNVWFWSGSGVCSYDGAQFHRWTAPGGSDGTTVSTIFRDHAGTMWFAVQGGGVIAWDGDAWTTYTSQPGLASDSISAVFEDAAHNMWFGSERGVTRYDGSTWITFTQADGLGVVAIDKVLQDGAGRVWFLDCGGGPTLSYYDGSAWMTYAASDLDWTGWYCSAAIDPEGSLVIGGWGYRARFDGSGWDVVGDEMGCSYVFSDRQGCIWVLHERGGVERVWGGRNDYYDAPAYAQSFFADRRGHIWVASRVGGGWLYRFDPTEHGVSFCQPNCMMEDRAGNIWLGGGEPWSHSRVWQYSRNILGWTDCAVAGLPGSQVQALFEDADGSVWAGTEAGVARLEGTAWTAYTTADGLVCDTVLTILQDQSGALWFGTARGASRLEGDTWRAYTTADGLPGEAVVRLLKDAAGTLWACAGDRVAKFDGTSWYAPETPIGTVRWVIGDGRGWLWFGTDEGLYSWDGTTYACWGPTPYGTPIFGDRHGNIWLNQDGVTAKFSGQSCWLNNWWDESASGIPSDVFIGLEDAFGCVWFGTPLAWVGNYSQGGLYMSVLDTAPPYTGIRNPPPRLTPERSHIISFATLQEPRPCDFSYSMNGSSWSSWSSDDFWAEDNLPDGVYDFWVRSRDWLGNIDTIGSRITLEIDGTPPVPILASPAFGQVVRDSIVILGTAADSRFVEYTLDVRPSEGTGAAPGEPSRLSRSTAAVLGGTLGAWNTTRAQDGSYELMLSVRDTLGLIGTALVEVVVDNHAPWASQTSPALVSTTLGGDVYATDGKLHLYFPPRAFDQDATVRAAAVADTVVPPVLPDGSVRIDAGYEVSWGGQDLHKSGSLDVRLGGLVRPDSHAVLALYVLADSVWRRLGGTVDEEADLISAPLGCAGCYALFSAQPEMMGPGALSSLSLNPRVFSPSGGFAGEDVAIGFTLGRSGPVTVKIYNRAGRLVREVASGRQLNSGANLIRWDGRDQSAEIVPSGIYFVTIEALGETASKTVSIVR
jgi:ligand-binding sensor domain-containing protein